MSVTPMLRKKKQLNPLAVRMLTFSLVTFMSTVSMLNFLTFMFLRFYVYDIAGLLDFKTTVLCVVCALEWRG